MGPAPVILFGFRCTDIYRYTLHRSVSTSAGTFSGLLYLISAHQQ